jgi:hypothetical protein
MLSDTPNYMTSFPIQFSFYLAKGMWHNSYYREKILPDWVSADQLWSQMTYASLPSSWQNFADNWGVENDNLYQYVWGTGAGDSGYSVDRINNSPDWVFSPHIMAGFMLKSASRNDIFNQLSWLYQNELCSYEKNSQSMEGGKVKILWRCSVKQPSWRSTQVQSVDYGTTIYGLATVLFGSGWFENYAF